MVKKIVFVTTWLAAFCLKAAAQPQVSIAPYYGGRQAALCLTFDDGLQDQYTLVFPELRKRGLKATFVVIGSKVGGVMRSKQDRQDGTDGTPCMTWDMLREMAADGQEIASHGWEHRAVTRLDREALRHEVEANDSAIMAHIGTKSMTYVYPGNNKSDEAVRYCEQGRVGSRTFQLSLGSKRTVEEMQRYVDTLIDKGEWGITMTHGIRQGYDHFKDPQVLWQFLDYVCLRQDQIWIATFRDVAAYLKERDHTQLVVKQTADGFIMTPKTALDSKLLQQPLTLMVNAPVGTAMQDGRTLDCIQKGDVTLININPNGGKIVVKNEFLPTHLTVEGRQAPMGLDVEHPRFGWQICSDKKNVIQQSYHIQVATSQKGQVDVWDSGIVNSDQSQWVEMKSGLQPNTTYYWRVKVKTNKGESQWSPWNQWTTGLLKEENWKGEWIGYDSLTADVVMERHSRIAARHLRQSFALSKPAYLSCYQELSNPLAVGTAYYAEDSLCSGGMKVVNLGHRTENDLQWRDVWCDDEGDYRVTVCCPSFPDNASLYVSATGAPAQRLRSQDKLTLTLRLRRGLNTIRLYSDGPMPDVDYMEISNCINTKQP